MRIRLRRIYPTGLIILLLSLVAIILVFIRDDEVKGSNVDTELVIEDSILMVKTEEGSKYEKQLLYPQFLEKVSLNYYEKIEINDQAIYMISLSCTEVEERGDFDSILLLSYKDGQFNLLVDGLEDQDFQYDHYVLSYLGDRTIRIQLPSSDFDVSLKNILTFDDPELNEDNEKDLTSRMEYQGSKGHPIFSQGLYNIKAEQEKNTIKVSFSKYVYGFFHTDIIGELNYVYEYQGIIQSLSRYKEFLPHEHYEIVE